MKNTKGKTSLFLYTFDFLWSLHHNHVLKEREWKIFQVSQCWKLQKMKVLDKTLSQLLQNAFFLSKIVLNSKYVTSLKPKPIEPGKYFKIYNPLRHSHSFCPLTCQAPDLQTSSFTFLWLWSFKKKKKKRLDISAFIACVYREDPSACLSAQCSVTDVGRDNTYKKEKDLLEQRSSLG